METQLVLAVAFVYQVTIYDAVRHFSQTVIPFHSFKGPKKMNLKCWVCVRTISKQLPVDFCNRTQSKTRWCLCFLPQENQYLDPFYGHWNISALSCQKSNGLSQPRWFKFNLSNKSVTLENAELHSIKLRISSLQVAWIYFGDSWMALR